MDEIMAAIQDDMGTLAIKLGLEEGSIIPFTDVELMLHLPVTVQ